MTHFPVSLDAVAAMFVRLREHMDKYALSKNTSEYKFYTQDPAEQFVLEEYIDFLVWNCTQGEKTFTRMVEVLNAKPEWWEYLRDFNDSNGFMWSSQPTFQGICTAFYADGRQCIDSGMIFLCRYMQVIARNGLQAFQDSITHR